MFDKSNTFPSSKYEALTFLYLQNQNLTDTTVENFVKLYEMTYKEIKDMYEQEANSHFAEKDFSF